MKRIIPTFAWLLTFVTWASHAGQVLMVVDDPVKMGPGDQAVKERIIDIGHTVKVVDDGACSSADASGCALVWVCDSVEPDKVGTKFKSVAAPVINCEPQLHDEFQITDGAPNSQGATEPCFDIITLAAMTDLMAYRFIGGVDVLSETASMNWAKPKGSAKIYAETYPHLPVIFTYDAGAAMHNGYIAPHKRAGFFSSGQSAADLKDVGLRLLDSIILWAAPPPPTPRLSYTKGISFEPINVDQYPEYSETPEIHISNIGTAPLTFYGITFNGPDVGKFQLMRQYNTHYPMQPGEGIILPFQFKPDVNGYDPGGKNHYEMTITVITNDPNDPVVNIKLSGETVPVELAGFKAE